MLRQNLDGEVMLPQNIGATCIIIHDCNAWRSFGGLAVIAAGKAEIRFIPHHCGG